MQNTQKIKCGVVGVGYLGQHHARIYASMTDSVEFVGIFDNDSVRAHEIASKHGTKVFESPEALAKECDAISVVTPTNYHCEVAVPLLEAGCHLLIEKPLCVTLDEATTILEAAQKNDRLVQVGHIEHFNPVMSYMEDVVNNPRYITTERLAPFNPRGTEVGVVLDLMIHDIGLVLALTKSEVERIDAVGFSVLTKTEDIANARLLFKNGAVANLNVSRISETKKREIRVFQPDAYLSMDFMNQQGHAVSKGSEGLSREDLPVEKAEPLALELRSFVDSIVNHRDPKVGASLGRSALEVALEVTTKVAQSQKNQ